MADTSARNRRYLLFCVIGIVAGISLWNVIPQSIPSLFRINSISTSSVAPVLPPPQSCHPGYPASVLASLFGPGAPPSRLEKLQPALDALRSRLDEHGAKTNDTVAVLVSHASGPELLWWGQGAVKLNETEDNPTMVSRDSIFRIASITKVYTTLQAILMSQENYQVNPLRLFSWDDPVKKHLPDFELPERFSQWRDKITLRMFAGHTSGLSRDVTADRMPESIAGAAFRTLTRAHGRHGFLKMTKESSDDHIHHAIHLLAPGTCHAFNGAGHQCTWREVLQEIANRGELIWTPGARPSYSNTGFDIMGWAMTAYCESVNFKPTSCAYTKLIKDTIFEQLGFTENTFFSPIPSSPTVQGNVTVPRSDNMVDLDFGVAYSPAGAIFSTPRDQTTFLQAVLRSYLSATPVSPGGEHLVPPHVANEWLKPSYPHTASRSLVGLPWEIFTVDTSTQRHYAYPKGGGLPGHLSNIVAVPSLGLASVAMTSWGSKSEDIGAGLAVLSDPNALNEIIVEILAPALESVIADAMRQEYEGMYVGKGNGGGESKAIIKVTSQGEVVIVYFQARGVNVLSTFMGDMDANSITGIKLVPSSIQMPASSSLESNVEIDEFRVGAILDVPSNCREWFGFGQIVYEVPSDDGKGQEGWGLDKIQFHTIDGNIHVVYKPLNVSMVRVAGGPDVPGRHVHEADLKNRV